MTIEAEFNAALTLHQAGHLDRAIAGYRRVLAAAPSQPAVMAYIGLAAAQRRVDRAALVLLSRARGLAPTDASVLSNLANVLVSLGRGDEASRLYRQAAALTPGLTTIFFNLAGLTAVPAHKALRYRIALACEPTSLSAMIGLAAAMDAGVGRSGRVWVRKAVAMAPAESAPHLAMSDHRLARNEPAAALESAMRAATLTLDRAPALFRAALAADRLRALDDAARACRRAIALAPAMNQAHSLLASLEFGAGFPALAVAIYGRASAASVDELADGNRLFALTFVSHDDPQAHFRLP
jgi:tetratricopeptide (TPR) repeat protein